MRVLLLHHNIASQMAVTARGLRALGHDVRCIAPHLYPHADNRGVTHMPLPWRRLRTPLGVAQWSWYVLKLIRALCWADVVHWQFGSRLFTKDRDLRLIRWFVKKRVVEFHGTDVRRPAVVSRDNPYVAAMYADCGHLRIGADAWSIENQRRFAAYGFHFVVPYPELLKSIEPDLLPLSTLIHQKIAVADYPVAYPDPATRVPLVVHA